ncbi:1,4-alpha-glucan branching protein domain-containing protein [Treponema sp.]|uniref:1,4-alpha-glucan branching protein domain-containing protein n=1 Tax=Treponema sp. TaxID=166 RepID=UPI00388D1491
MSNKKLALIIEADQAFIRNTEKDSNFTAENNVLFTALTETYIPLLNMFGRLEEENIDFKFGVVMSPALCFILDDAQIQKQYIDHLDNLIALGKSELKRCKGTDCEAHASACLAKIEKTKTDFTETYGQNILGAFKKYADKGNLELIPTAATYAYLPHYEDFPEAINAQVETGIYSHRHFFGETGEGFWLPYQGWSRSFEWTLRSYGANYTVVDARSILFAKDCPETGIYAPLRTRTSLVVFGLDPDSPKEIIGEDGFSQNEIYRSQRFDIGYELKQDLVSAFFNKNDARIETGYKYWSNESEDDDLIPYNGEKAAKQAIEDAISFYESKLEKLDAAAEHIKDDNAVLVCSIPAEALGQKWHEGIQWLENVIRCTASKQGFDFALCKDLIEKQFSLPKINPYPCSSNGLGYGEDLVDSSNSWMIRYVRKATERMIDLTERFPAEDSLKERLLNMAAKQVLLAQSGEWPMMLHDSVLSDYVNEQFKDEILSFTKVFDALASNTVSTEWLTNCEKKNPLFPWLNYRIFCRKK